MICGIKVYQNNFALRFQGSNSVC